MSFLSKECGAHTGSPLLIFAPDLKSKRTLCSECSEGTSVDIDDEGKLERELLLLEDEEDGSRGNGEGKCDGVLMKLLGEESCAFSGTGNEGSLP